MKHMEANRHFDDAEKHIANGDHKAAWKSINSAQNAAAHHARTLAESGDSGHQASLAYRKIVMGRVGHLARKMTAEPSKTLDKAMQFSAMQIAKAEALSFVWELMKKDPARFKYLIPQIELAKTPDEIHDVFKRYGFQPIRKMDDAEYEEMSKKAEKGGRVEAIVGNHVYKIPQTPQERDEQWRRIISASKKAEKLLTEKNRK